jgi:nucleoside-diphosphate-sugar epimerase
VTSESTLVTGAGGFLGQHVCAMLVRRGGTVRGLVRSRTALPSGVESSFCADLLDRPAIRSALAGVESVIHLAARVHLMGDSAPDPLAEYRRVNVEGTRLLAEEAARAGVRRFLLMSSVKALGESTAEPWTEETPPAPVGPYGVSKLEAERVLLGLAASSELHAVVLRLPLVYGPGMRANMLRLFELVDRGVPLPLKLVRNRRSLVFAGNVVAAIERVMNSPAAAGQVFFVRDERDLSTPELVRQIASALGRRARLVPVPVGLFRAVGRMGDLLSPVVKTPVSSPVVDRLLGSLVVDASKLTRVTGFCPTVRVEEGMRLTAEWYLARTRTGG